MKRKISEPLIAGVDEAGRGPLAGPVIAAAVILNPHRPIPGLADSKVLSAKQRESLFADIRQHALAFAVARASVAEIDEINILHASLLAMKRAVHGLKMKPECVLVDGNRCPEGLLYAAQAVIGGDKTEPAISAASIVAKVFRDRIMMMLDRKYPVYGFRQHKGYSTSAHVTVLNEHGPCRVHRQSFAPVLASLESKGMKPRT